MKYLWCTQSKSTNKIIINRVEKSSAQDFRAALSSKTLPTKPSISSCLHKTLTIKFSAFGSLQKNVFPNLRPPFCLFWRTLDSVLDWKELDSYCELWNPLPLLWEGHRLTATLLPSSFLFNVNNNWEPRVLRECLVSLASSPGPGTLLTVQCREGLFPSPDYSLVSVTEWLSCKAQTGLKTCQLVKLRTG